MRNENGWVPVALSVSIEPGTSAGAVVAGAEVVVWRDDKGAAHVWEDRCPHRGMRMSFGFVRGDHIACLYHGWAYDAAGQCSYIPAHPDLEVPKTIKIPTYATIESDGVIWTTLTEAAGDAVLPSLGVSSPVRSLYADCSFARAKTVLSAASLPAAGVTVFEAMAENVWSLSAGALKVLFAAQVVSPTCTALHIVMDEASAALKPAIARFAEALRLALEAPVTAPVSEVA